MLNLIEAEREILKNIKKNDLLKAISIYNLYYSTDKFYKESTLDTIRCKKNNLICLFCSLSRFLDCDDSKKICEISDKFINDLEQINSKEKLDLKAIEAIEFFSKYNNQIDKYDNFFVNNAIKFINENYSNNLSLDDISKELHISKSHLSYLFIKNTGMKITQYINKVRIKEAKNLLINSNHSLSYISNVCGFNNQNYFSTMFKKIESITPLEYRKLKR